MESAITMPNQKSWVGQQIKLKDFMNTAKETHPDRIYHIAAEEGSGLIFVGTPEEFFEYIGKLEEINRSEIVTAYAHAKIKRENLDSLLNLVKATGFSSATTRKIEEDRNAAEREETRYKKILKEWLPFCERYITETFSDLLYEGSHVRFEGYGDGQFWLRDEFERWTRGEVIVLEVPDPEIPEDYTPGEAKYKLSLKNIRQTLKMVEARDKRKKTKCKTQEVLIE